ncbi:MAG TPA: hypothetical protein EYP14_02225, partial [Planctomycetaceae bacterium]|nr:hypothetical protein [Planctomycetaceae bacterium]
MTPNMLGAYGDWAAAFVGAAAGPLSFRHADWQDVALWRRAARQRFQELLCQPAEAFVPEARVKLRLKGDGLVMERLEWPLPYGPPTEAVFLMPENATGPLPAVLALHDHGAVKFFGWEKIARLDSDCHPMMAAHRRQYYGGRAWANELARRGYAVLAPDAFAFGSRRVRLRDIPSVVREAFGVADLPDVDRRSPADIRRYESFAAQHEHVMAKSLFCAGTTWPGVFTYEDQRALDYLCSRPEVDPQRIGCCGLSGGGLRTVYLAGLDDRVACASCVGMMTTWRDFLLHKSYSHTWMIYVPGLPRQMDYPDIFSLMAPKPVFVLNNEQDELFTLEEMRRADGMLRSVYAKAGAADRYCGSFYPGPH